MLLPIIISTIIFFSIGFTPTDNTPQSLNPFLSYAYILIVFITTNWFHFCLLFLLLSFLFLRKLKFEKNNPFYQKFLYAVTFVLTGSLLGFLISFVLLFLVAIIQVNSTSLLLSTTRELFGVVSSKKEIVQILKSNRRPPEIIATDNNAHKELLAIISATTGRNNYYGRTLVPSVPSFLALPIRQDAGMFLIDNTLIVSKIEKDDMQTLSPVIGNLLIKNYFPTRRIKAYPKITIVDKEEYIRFRKDQNIEKLKKNEEELTKVKENIATLSASLEIDKKTAQELESTSSAKLAIQKRELSQIADKVASDSALLEHFKLYEAFYELQKKLLENQDLSTVNENGLFLPPDAIKIVYTTDNPHRIADYFATLTHEYLHYASYISPNASLKSAFFEEGLTEYFARMSIQTDLQTSTNLGYPVQARIIKEMTNLIPESEFAEIYFTKDQEALELSLNRVYGDNFFKETQLTLENIAYAKDPDQLLKLANEIMKKIGGPPLSQNDLYSSFSKL